LSSLKSSCLNSTRYDKSVAKTMNVIELFF
jgi:hypothetical protein